MIEHDFGFNSEDDGNVIILGVPEFYLSEEKVSLINELLKNTEYKLEEWDLLSTNDFNLEDKLQDKREINLLSVNDFVYVPPEIEIIRNEALLKKKKEREIKKEIKKEKRVKKILSKELPIDSLDLLDKIVPHKIENKISNLKINNKLLEEVKEILYQINENTKHVYFYLYKYILDLERRKSDKKKQSEKKKTNKSNKDNNININRIDSELISNRINRMETFEKQNLASILNIPSDENGYSLNLEKLTKEDYEKLQIFLNKVDEAEINNMKINKVDTNNNHINHHSNNINNIFDSDDVSSSSLSDDSVSISDYINKFKNNKSDGFKENKISDLVFNQYFNDDD